MDREWLKARLAGIRSSTFNPIEKNNFRKAFGLIQLMVWHEEDNGSGWNQVQKSIDRLASNEIAAALIIVGEHMSKNAKINAGGRPEENITWQEVLNIFDPK